MANTKIIDKSIISIIVKYINELEAHNIPIKEAIVFGSFAKGCAREGSDIDVALISPFFTGDRFEDRCKIVPLRRKIDSRIEPMPFRPQDYYEGGVFADEIKKTGVKIKIE